MGKIITKIAETHINKNFTDEYELSILLGMGSLCYMVSDNQEQVLLLKDRNYSTANSSTSGDFLVSLIEKEEYLNLKYSKVTIGMISPVSTLLPSRLFDVEKKSTYLQGVTNVSADDRVLSDHISAIDSVNVYSVPAYLLKICQNHFPQSNLFNSSSGLIKYFKQKKGTNSTFRLFLTIYSDFFQAFLFNGDELLIFNTYSFKASTDFLYCVLLIFNQFKLQIESVPVFLSGKITKDSEMFNILSRYVKQVEFLEFPAHLQYRELLKKQPSHYYTDLFALKLLP
ncbi:MAG: DUF3822 family protein [Bacteroidetes bacterium]|nr:DUF3822 family protein [Bacteroidota bacterium]